MDYNELKKEIQKKESIIDIGKDQFELFPASIFLDILVSNKSFGVLDDFWQDLGSNMFEKKMKNKKALLEFIKKICKNIGFGDIKIKINKDIILGYMSSKNFMKKFPRAKKDRCLCFSLNNFILGILKKQFEKDVVIEKKACVFEGSEICKSKFVV